MPIQWFPGHMAAARKKVAETLARIDVVIEVLDARCPEASRNPLIRQLVAARQRPTLRVLNKTDLADPAVTRAWLDHYAQVPGMKAVAISCKKPGDVARLPAMCRQLAPHRNDPTKPLRMMIMGIPNVGKSTLLNALLKRRIAAVGDEPAITRHVQNFDLASDMTITDTPGLMWPKIEHDFDGFMLAACHAIGRNAVIDEEVAVFLAGILLERYPAQLAARYRIDCTTLDAIGVLEAVAQRRGCLRRGRLDLEKAAQIMLEDFRSRALGRISLETPQSRAAMLAIEHPPSFAPLAGGS